MALLANVRGRVVRWKAVNGFSSVYRGITNYRILRFAILSDSVKNSDGSPVYDVYRTFTISAILLDRITRGS